MKKKNSKYIFVFGGVLSGATGILGLYKVVEGLTEKNEDENNEDENNEDENNED